LGQKGPGPVKGDHVDLRIFSTTFIAIFLAELADKTQLVGMGMAAKTGKPLLVYIGSVCAYIIVTAISILLGTLLAKYIRPDLIRYVGAATFVIIGILMLTNKM
jgi:putative Ca2+/H+ antiporter (TMEM165/GDT1 family)